MDMNKIRRRAYREVWKEGKTHQEVYDAIREETKESPEELAIVISAVPSPAKNQEKKMFWMLTAFLLFCVAGLRSYALIETPPEEISKLGYTIPLALFGIALPLYSILGVTKAKMLSYGWGGISSMVTLIMVYAQDQFISDSMVHVTAIFAGLAMLSGIILPRLMKMKFKVSVEKKEVDGKIKNRQVITFE